MRTKLDLKWTSFALIVVLATASIWVMPAVAQGEGGGADFNGVSALKTIPKKVSKKSRGSQTAIRSRATNRAQRGVRVIESAPSGQPPANEIRFIDNEVIVRFQRSSSRALRTRLIARENLLRLDTRTFVLPGVTVHRYQITDGRSVPSVIAALESSTAIVNAQPNYTYQLTQSDDQKVTQYANDRLRVAETHNLTKGAGAKIAVIDTAIDITHPEFAGAEIKTVNVADTIDVNVDSHGTSMAGILSASGRLTGISPDSAILGIAAFSKDATGKTFGNTWTISESLSIALEQNARILNLSFAGPADPLVEDGMNGAARRGMFPIAAAGNAGAGAAPLYPAAYQSVFAVTAVDASDNIYNQANQGDYIEFAAPGVQVVTLNNKNGFGVSSGTSVATAYFSGLVALILSTNPSLTFDSLRDVLQSGSKDLGQAGRDPVFGHGVPDVQLVLGVGS